MISSPISNSLRLFMLFSASTFIDYMFPLPIAYSFRNKLIISNRKLLIGSPASEIIGVIDYIIILTVEYFEITNYRKIKYSLKVLL